jgi:hypothetical protein
MKNRTGSYPSPIPFFDLRIAKPKQLLWEERYGGKVTAFPPLKKLVRANFNSFLVKWHFKQSTFKTRRSTDVFLLAEILHPQRENPLIISPRFSRSGLLMQSAKYDLHPDDENNGGG